MDDLPPLPAPWRARVVSALGNEASQVVEYYYREEVLRRKRTSTIRSSCTASTTTTAAALSSSFSSKSSSSSVTSSSSKKVPQQGHKVPAQVRDDQVLPKPNSSGSIISRSTTAGTSSSSSRSSTASTAAAYGELQEEQTNSEIIEHISLIRPPGPAQFSPSFFGGNSVARVLDANGAAWRVRILDVDPLLGSYECTVLDSKRSHVHLFEADLVPFDSVAVKKPGYYAGYGITSTLLEDHCDHSLGQRSKPCRTIKGNTTSGELPTRKSFSSRRSTSCRLKTKDDPRTKTTTHDCGDVISSSSTFITNCVRSASGFGSLQSKAPNTSSAEQSSPQPSSARLYRRIEKPVRSGSRRTKDCKHVSTASSKAALSTTTTADNTATLLTGSSSSSCTSTSTALMIRGFGVAQDFLGLCSWSAALLQDLPRKWASDAVAN
ncbi:unnamed protein product [Amoebophrya sp. A25]|nr:unnamed protein product [Amoebophrya sp. A25]|eukprot:GSA25T00023902001.1